jgi:uncharacterized integral membrane protein (TIGR02327 family)
VKLFGTYRRQIVVSKEGFEWGLLKLIANFGQQALLSIFTHVIFIALAWWALQSLNFDKFLRGNKVFQARVLYVLLSIIIGSLVSDFFLDYLTWSQQLPLIMK